MAELVAAWRDFWLAPVEQRHVAPIRVAACLVAGIWFASFWPGIDIWFGPAGILQSSVASEMLAFEEVPPWQVASPLWWTDAAWAYYAWVAIGCGLSLVSALGLGGRWSLLCLLMWMLGWAHRILWLTGLVEPAVIALVGYLIIEPGPSWIRGPKSVTSSKPLEDSSPQASWQSGLVLRLIQTHWWILFAASVCGQLAGQIWWSGEAMWWLTAAGTSHWPSVETLRGQAAWVNGLTHGLIILELLALWLLVVRSARWLGIGLSLTVCLAVGLLTGQWLYGATLAAGLFAFRPVHPMATVP